MPIDPDHLHSKLKILRNDLKDDNIVLTLQSYTKLMAIIIDFGKACELGDGKRYSRNKKRNGTKYTILKSHLIYAMGSVNKVKQQMFIQLAE